MDQTVLARHIAQTILQALQAASLEQAGAESDLPVIAAAEPAGCSFTVASRGGCAACNPGACWVCGYLFAGETIVIAHHSKGKRVLSDKAVHYLSHGLTHYETGYVIHGEPVVVDLDLAEIAGYLDLAAED